MSFDTEGFLGNQASEIIKENYESHKDIFKLCEEINLYAQSVKYNFKIYQDDIQGILAMALFIKILNTFQAVVILYKYELNSQSKVLTRVELESLFILKSIIKDKNNVYLFIKSENKEREKLLNKINKNPHGVFNSLFGEDLNKKSSDLKEKNKNEQAKEIHISEWAEKSELYYEYYYAYKLLCKDVHVDIRNIEQYIIADDKGNIKEFNIMPSTKDIKEVLLHTAGSAMVKAMICMSEYSDLKNGSIIDDFLNRIVNIK